MSMLELNSWTFSEEQDFVFVAVRGEDAENFLQGMLTQNVKTMGPTDARWTAACNHQGRTAATSLIVRIPNGFGMLMPKSISQDEVDRLSKFILRSKVEIEILPEPITYFCSDDAKAIDRPCPALPREPMQAFVGDSVIVVRLPSNDAQGMHGKFVAIGKIPDDMYAPIKAHNRLARSLMEEGIALIEKPESLEWLPQALNMDLIGGIAFNKGCYTGQEMVARAKFRGANKRALWTLSGTASRVPEAGEDLELKMGDNWRRTGTVLAAVQLDDGSLMVQVVMNNDMEPDSVFRVRDDAGSLSIKPLPYSLEEN